MGPSSGRGGREAKNWWSCKEFEEQIVNNTWFNEKQESEIFLQIASHVPVARGAWSRRMGPDKLELLFLQ
jgi:hypothetical protein